MHKHWNIQECGCNISNHDLHMQYMQLAGEVFELLNSLDAKDQLDKGFRGMGHNILIEKAAHVSGHLRRIKELIGDIDG